MNKKGKNIKGLTIVELLIAAGVGLILLGVLGFIYIVSDRSFKFGKDNIKIESELRLAMDWVTKDLREAKNANYDPGTGTLTITLPQESGGVNIEYTFSDGYLTRYDYDAESPRKIRKIASVSFEAVSISGPTVTVTLKSQNDATKTLTSQVTMRNWKPEE